MNLSDKPIANPLIVLREEFDDWAILFDPDTGNGFGLNPVSVFIWKRLDGEHSVKEILDELRMECKDAPDNAGAHVEEFLEELLKNGLTGYGFEKE
jgi:SynChlorMet cassette protein ScmD